MEEEITPQDDAGRRLEMTAKILILAYWAISVLWVTWQLIPEHQRRLMAMRAAKTAGKSAWRTAFRTGHQAMGLEISGRGTNYELPYLLSRLAATCERIYEKLRYSA